MSHRIQPYLYLRKSTCLLALLLYNLNLFSQGNECGTALELKNISNYCSGAGAFNNSSASPSSTFTPSCWTSTGNDVWFRFTAIAFDLIATVNGKVSGSGTMLLPQIAIYEGDCANLSLIGCEAAQPLSHTVTLYKGKLKVGDEYYIRVSAASSDRGTFQLCINNYIQTPKPGQDCIDAVYLCNK